MKKEVQQKDIRQNTQAEENEALLHKGYRGKPVFTLEEKCDNTTGENRIFLG